MPITDAIWNGARPASGQWLASPQNAGTIQVPEGKLRACPLPLARALTITQLAIWVTGLGAAGAVMRLGVYADDGTNNPGRLIVDAGTVDCASTNASLASLPALGSVVLGSVLACAGAQNLWLAGVCQGSASTRPTIACNTSAMPLVVGDAASLIGPNTLSCAVHNAGAAVSGALPALWIGTTKDVNGPRVLVLAQ